MKIIAIADLHLSLGEGINKSMEVFGGAWLGYVERLKENWEYIVSPEDLVLIPGDISWAMHLEEAMADLEWLDALPGKKLLLRGNHDLWWSSMKKMKGLFPSIEFLQNDAYLDAEHGFAVIGSRGWLCPGDGDFKETEDGKIYRREILRLQMSLADLKAKCKASQCFDPYIIGMMHYPPTNARKDPSDFTDIFRDAGANQVIYGHLHSEKAFGNGPAGSFEGSYYRLVSLDRLNAMPICLYEC